MTLEENMRIRNSGNDPRLVDFDNWLEHLGDGGFDYIEEEESDIVLPEYFSVEIVETQREKS